MTEATSGKTLAMITLPKKFRGSIQRVVITTEKGILIEFMQRGSVIGSNYTPFETLDPFKLESY